MRSWRLPFVVMVVLVPVIGGAPASAQPQGRKRPLSCGSIRARPKSCSVS